MSIGELLRAVRKLWWVVVLGLLLGTGAGVYIAYSAVPKYASSVTFFVTTPSTGTGSALQGDQFGQQRVNSYVKVLKSQRLAEVIAGKVPGLSVPYVIDALTGEADLNTVLLTATVTDNSAARSMAIASVVATEFPNLVDQIESLNGKKVAPVDLEVISGPSDSSVPVSPNKKIDIGVGALIGLGLGLAFAVLRKVFDSTVRSSEELPRLIDVPVLGVLTADRTSKKQPLITALNLRTPRAESFRQLRTNLRFVDIDQPAKLLVVTSSVAGEGKSSIAVNLAIAFVQGGGSVLLIDADLRRPKLAEYLGLEGAVGLTNVLAQQVQVQDVIQTWGKTALAVLPSGSIPPNPSELLGSHQMLELVTELRSRYDMIIIDTPPLLPVTDASVVAAYADGAVVIVRYGKTKRDLIEAAVAHLRAVDARILGAILNFAPTRGADAERAHRGYGYYSVEPKKSGNSRRRRAGSGRSAGDDPNPSSAVRDLNASAIGTIPAVVPAPVQPAGPRAAQPAVATESGTVAPPTGGIVSRRPGGNVSQSPTEAEPPTGEHRNDDANVPGKSTPSENLEAQLRPGRSRTSGF